MKAMGPIPAWLRGRGGDAQLLIGGWSAEELVDAGRRHALVRLRQQHRSAGRSPASGPRCPTGFALHYAVKANPYAPLLRLLARYGRRLRHRLGGRAAVAQDAELEGLPISFAGPGKRDAGDSRPRSRAGVTINLESEGEAERALAIAERDRPAAEAGGAGQSAVRASRAPGMKMGGLASPFGVDA